MVFAASILTILVALSIIVLEIDESLFDRVAARLRSCTTRAWDRFVERRGGTIYNEIDPFTEADEWMYHLVFGAMPEAHMLNSKFESVLVARPARTKVEPKLEPKIDKERLPEVEGTPAEPIIFVTKEEAAALMGHNLPR